MSLSEFDLIARYFKRPASHPSVLLGVGDDCALVDIEQGKQMVMSIDTSVAGRHFPQNDAPADIASRAFCTALSDLAAMGADPRWYTLALTLPEVDSTWLQAFSDSLHAIADEYHCELIGGDTTQGPLTISIQVHGLVQQNKPLRRDGAQVGDLVFVSGYVGDGAAALELIMDKNNFGDISTEQRQYLQSHFYRPQVQIQTGLALVGLANSAIDVSDGLLADLQHIASASDVDIDVDIERLPLSPACLSIAGSRRQALEYALSGGDDYQLVFTIVPDKLKDLHILIDHHGLQLTQVGEVLAKKEKEAQVICKKTLGYDRLKKLRKGFQHFAS